jgi:hypothetical protein
LSKLKNAESPILLDPVESLTTDLDEPDTTQCGLCDLNCVSEASLDFHIKTVHKRLHVCTRCPHFMSMIKNKLTKHLAFAHKEPPAKRRSSRYDCKHCLFSTRDMKDMSSHQIEKHSLQLRYTTPPPTRPAATIINLSNKNNNSIQRTPSAEPSSENKADSAEIKGPQETAKQIAKKKLAEQKSVTIKPAKTKIRSNPKKFLMKCTLCSFQTSTSDLINYHFGKQGHFATGVKVACPHCPYMATNPKDLYSHGKTHTEGFVLFSYICKLCTFKAISLASIEKHILHHSRNKI